LLALGEAARARIHERALDNLTILRDALRDSAASVLRVEGGWYAIVRMPGLLDDEAWALLLLEEDDVLVQPGFYYELYGAQLVLSLLVDAARMRQAATRLAARVAALSHG
jgi:aspartate/methionine/tyrosine aminotransferase